MIRKLTLAAALWLGLAGPASAAVAVVQCTSNASMATGTSTTSNAITLTPTLPSAPSASHLVVLFAHDACGSPLTGAFINLPSGYSQGPYYYSSNAEEDSWFYITGSTATSASVAFNCTTGGSSYYAAAAMCELSGANNANPMNVNASTAFALGTTGGGTGTGAGPLTPATSGMLALSGWAWTDDGRDTYGNTVQSGWTANFNNSVVQTNYASVYIASLASPTVGTGLTSTLNVVGTSYVSPGFNNVFWIINPAGYPASFSLYPQEGAYPGGQP